jgi:hypothetical protein
LPRRTDRPYRRVAWLAPRGRKEYPGPMRPVCKGLPALQVRVAGPTQQCGLERDGHGGITDRRVNNGYSIHLPNPPDTKRLGKGVAPERCPGVLGSRSWARRNFRAGEGEPSARADGLANLINEIEGPKASAYQSRQAATHLRLATLSAVSNIVGEQFWVRGP